MPRAPAYCRAFGLIVEPPSKFGVDFARIVEVEAAEGEAVVNEQVAIADVERGEGDGVALAERFADGNIKRRVAGQVGAGEGLARRTVGESGTVVNVGGCECSPGEGSVEADVEGVALVVIERRVSELRKRKIGEAAGDRASRERDLVRIGEMELAAAPEAGRPQSGFPRADEGSVDSEREKDV